MHKYTHTAFNSTFYLPKYFCTISILGVLEKARIWLFFKIVSQNFWNWSNFEEHTLVYQIVWHLLGTWYRKGKWTADHVNGGAEGNLEHQPQHTSKIKINAWLFIFFRKIKIKIKRKSHSWGEGSHSSWSCQTWGEEWECSWQRLCPCLPGCRPTASEWGGQNRVLVTTAPTLKKKKEGSGSGPGSASTAQAGTWYPGPRRPEAPGPTGRAMGLWGLLVPSGEWRPYILQGIDVW